MIDTCPCCHQSVALDPVALGDALMSLSDHARDVFDCVLFGAPRAVSAQEIFDYAYSDDESGGPSEPAMRKAFNAALAELDQKLRGSPVRVVHSKRPRGWVITLQQATDQAA